MSKLIRQMRPEEEELVRKREELRAIRVTLAGREPELVDVRRQLAAFASSSSPTIFLVPFYRLWRQLFRPIRHQLGWMTWKERLKIS
jgi:hypothetical protein